MEQRKEKVRRVPCSSNINTFDIRVYQQTNRIISVCFSYSNVCTFDCLLDQFSLCLLSVQLELEQTEKNSRLSRNKQTNVRLEKGYKHFHFHLVIHLYNLRLMMTVTVDYFL